MAGFTMEELKGSDLTRYYFDGLNLVIKPETKGEPQHQYEYGDATLTIPNKIENKIQLQLMI